MFLYLLFSALLSVGAVHADEVPQSVLADKVSYVADGDSTIQLSAGSPVQNTPDETTSTSAPANGQQDSPIADDFGWSWKMFIIVAGALAAAGFALVRIGGLIS